MSRCVPSIGGGSQGSRGYPTYRNEQFAKRRSRAHFDSVPRSRCSNQQFDANRQSAWTSSSIGDVKFGRCTRSELFFYLSKKLYK